VRGRCFGKFKFAGTVNGDDGHHGPEPHVVDEQMVQLSAFRSASNGRDAAVCRGRGAIGTVGMTRKNGPERVYGSGAQHAVCETTSQNGYAQ
jgi:hypothetical protein